MGFSNNVIAENRRNEERRLNGHVLANLGKGQRAPVKTRPTALKDDEFIIRLQSVQEGAGCLVVTIADLEEFQGPDDIRKVLSDLCPDVTVGKEAEPFRFDSSGWVLEANDLVLGKFKWPFSFSFVDRF